MKDFFSLSCILGSSFLWHHPSDLIEIDYFGEPVLVPYPPICFIIAIYGDTWNQTFSRGNFQSEISYYGISFHPLPLMFENEDDVPWTYALGEELKECFKNPDETLRRYNIPVEFG